MIRAIGTSARPNIERIIGAKVMLDLRVRSQSGWRDDPALLDRLGP
jgi:GTP-binding protein Era